MTSSAGSEVAQPPGGRAGIPFRCAPTALSRNDQRYGTAAPAARWMLIEHPGPWVAHAFDASPTLVATAERANAAGVRAVLIRRPGRSEVADHRRWAYVDSRPGREGIWWGTFAAESDLIDVPLEGRGEPSREPTYLVCTHGRHDPCCAIWGRPVAASLQAERPSATWECSHVGGDRFAANLIALPHGLYYGHARPDTALEIAKAYESSQVVPEWLRGRSSLPAPVQAAQHYARLALHEYGVDALRALAVESIGDQVWRVRLAGECGEAVVTVRAGRAAPAMLTCTAGRAQSARTFELVSLDVA